MPTPSASKKYEGLCRLSARGVKFASRIFEWIRSATQEAKVSPTETGSITMRMYTLRLLIGLFVLGWMATATPEAQARGRKRVAVVQYYTAPAYTTSTFYYAAPVRTYVAPVAVRTYVPAYSTYSTYSTYRSYRAPVVVPSAYYRSSGAYYVNPGFGVSGYVPSGYSSYYYRGR